MAKETKVCQTFFLENWKYIPNKNYFSLCHIYCFKCVCTHLDITYKNNNNNNT